MFILGSTVRFEEHCLFWGANGIVKRLLFILGSTVHFGERCSFSGASFILGSTVYFGDVINKTWPQKSIKWHQFKTWPQKLIKWHQNDQCSPKWTALPKMNSASKMKSAPQNEQCSPKRTEASLLYHWLPKTNSTPQNDMNVWRKKLKKMAVFATETWTKLAKKNLWLGICVEKGFWAKKSAQLVIPVCSTFQNDSHPPIEGHHPVLHFTTQIKKKYCTAMC